MLEIPIRFRAGLGRFIVAVALVICVVGLITGGLHLVLLGALQIAMGWAFAVKPTVIVFRDRVELRNLLGMTMKTFPIAGLHQLRIEGGKVMVPEEEGTKALGGALTRPEDLAVLQAAITEAGTPASP
jgi:hypothetical protein